MKNKDQIISETIDLFIKRFNVKPEFTCAHPGRVNLIGEHLDYNNGVSQHCQQALQILQFLQDHLL